MEVSRGGECLEISSGSEDVVGQSNVEMEYVVDNFVSGVLPAVSGMWV